MKSGAAIVLAAAGSVAGGVLPRQVLPTINTPSGLVTCEPVSITFTGGTAPFFLSVYPGGTTTNPYIQFPSTNASPFQWNVNIAAGNNVTIGIRDGNGNTNADSPLVITAGPDTSCVNITGTGSSTGSSSSGSSPSSSSGAASSSSAPASSASSPASSQSSGGSPTTSGTSPASTTGSSGSGAGMVKAGVSTLVLGALGVLASLL